MEQEMWKPVPGYDGLVEASTRGRVRRTDTDYVTEGSLNSYGYRVTSFRINGKKYDDKVHRLVAKAFLPNPGGRRTVNHIDGDRTNNRLENLEWATHKEQMIHAQTLPTVSHRGRRVLQMTTGYKLIAVWESVNAAAETLGCAQMMISACCQGTAASAYGFLWAYAESEDAQKDAILHQIRHYMGEIEGAVARL